MRLTRRGRRRLLVLVVLVIVASSSLATFLILRSSFRAEEAAAARANGLAAYRSGDYAQARGDLLYAYDQLDAGERDLEVAEALGEVIWRYGVDGGRAPKAALQFFRKVAEWDPLNRNALERILELNISLRDWDAVVDAAESLLRIDREHEIALGMVARLSAGPIVMAERMRTILGVIGLEPAESETLEEMRQRLGEHLVATQPANLGWRVIHLSILSDLGMSAADRLEVCRAWAEADPERADLRLLESRVAMEAGDRDAAAAAAEAAAGLAIEDRVVLTGLLATLELLNQLEIGDALLERVRSEQPDAEWIDVAAVERDWRGLRDSRARAEAPLLAPDDPALALEALRWRALIAYEAELVSADHPERSVEVLDVLERRLEEAGNTIEIDNRDFTRAWIEAFRGMAAEDPDATRSEQLAAWERALGIRWDPVSAFLYASVLEAIDEPWEAFDVLESLATTESSWVGLAVARARVLLELRLPRPAIEVLRPILSRTGERGGRIALTIIDAWLALSLRDRSMVAAVDIVDTARRLHEAVGWDWQVTPAYARVLAATGESDSVRALIESAIADPDVPGEVVVSLVPVSAQVGLGLEQRLIEAAGPRQLTVRGLEALVEWLVRGDAVAQAARIVNATLGGSFPTDADRQRVERMAYRLRFLAGMDDSRDALLLTVTQATDVPWLARLADDERVWADLELARACVERLEALCGSNTARVRLGTARLEYEDADRTPRAAGAGILRVQPIVDQLPGHRGGHLLLATLFLATDPPNLEGAANALADVFALEPRNAPLAKRLVELRRASGKAEEARLVIEQLERSAGADPGLLRATGELWASTGDVRRAADTYRRFALHPTTGTDEDRARLAELLHDSGRGAEARALLTQLAASGNARSITTLAELEAASGNWSAALEMLGRVGGTVTERGVRLAVFERDHGRVDDAVERLRTVTAGLSSDEPAGGEPAAAVAWLELARTLLARTDDQNRLDEAADALRRAVDLDPQAPELRSQLAATIVTLAGLLPERGADLRSMAAGLGATSSYLDAAVALLAVRGSPSDEDLAAALELVEQYPEAVVLRRLAIELHAGAGRLTTASTLAEAAVVRFPTDAALHELHTRILLSMQRLDAALSAARSWREVAPRARFEIDVVMAAILLDLGRDADAWSTMSAHTDRLAGDWASERDGARVWLDAALRAAPWPQVTAELNALLDSDSERVEQALDALMRVRAARLAELDALLAPRVETAERWRRVAQRAVNADAAADHATSVAAYRLLAAMRDDNFGVLNNFALALMASGGDCAEAVSLAERATSLAPADAVASVRDTLAQALLCAGDRTRAESEIRGALELAPDRPGLVVTLAEVMAAAGRTEEKAAAVARAESLLAGEPDTKLERRLRALRGG